MAFLFKVVPDTWTPKHYESNDRESRRYTSGRGVTDRRLSFSFTGSVTVDSYGTASRAVLLQGEVASLRSTCEATRSLVGAQDRYRSLVHVSDVSSAVGELKHDRIVLIRHSLGGDIATRFAAFSTTACEPIMQPSPMIAPAPITQ